ncbi:hypothetical protein XarbCFBP7629_21790, partial [Xanthomonas arboricola]
RARRGRSSPAPRWRCNSARRPAAQRHRRRWRHPHTQYRADRRGVPPACDRPFAAAGLRARTCRWSARCVRQSGPRS